MNLDIFVKNCEFISSDDRMYKLCNNVYLTSVFESAPTLIKSANLNFLKKKAGRITHSKSINIAKYMPKRNVGITTDSVLVLDWTSELNKYKNADILNKKIIKLLSSELLLKYSYSIQYKTQKFTIDPQSYMADMWNGLFILS